MMSRGFSSDCPGYITVSYKNMIKGSKGNFDAMFDGFQNLSYFDYGSIMQYLAFAFSRNGAPVIESIPPWHSAVKPCWLHPVRY